MLNMPRQHDGADARGKRPVRLAAGFTLVEMLVAVTLVLLMMLLFAEILQLATSAVTAQRAIAENDQKARSVVTILRGDLDKRSFRNVVPFFADEDSGTDTTSFSNRKGYFYISENATADDTNDVLQFTVRSTITTTNEDESPYVGRAVPLAPLRTNPNQPEADDGYLSVNESATSTAAEIAYFLRGNRLYRRVLLVREPLPVIGDDPQPTNNSGNEFFAPGGPYGNGDFWSDFDFSAYSTIDFSASTNMGAEFNSVEGLSDLGKPSRRFGHDHDTGMPREFTQRPDAPAKTFIGRFTHEESSHDDFNYPHLPSNFGTGNPMDDINSANFFSLNTRSIAQPFAGGPRRSHDLLLTNVHSFDVKIWDDQLEAFVDVGHDDADGDYYQSPESVNPAGDVNNANRHLAAGINYGPHSPTSPAEARNRVFDTWHPNIDINGDGTKDPPPFRPMEYYPVGGAPAPPSRVAGQWQPSTPYNVGDVVFPLNKMPFTPFGEVYAYRCVRAGNSGPSAGSDEPDWTTNPGQNFSTGMNRPVWQVISNLRPLRAIQITIRFTHGFGGEMRQVTLVHSLVD